MINFITKINIDGKHQFWDFIWYQNCVAEVVILAAILDFEPLGDQETIFE